jgi:hypothetical protein
MTREYRWNIRVDKQWQYVPGISPRVNRFKFLFWKLKNQKDFSPEFTAALEDANLRCLDCGCKYNFQKITQCPRCNSDKSSILGDEDPWTDPVIYLTIGALTILAFALRPVLMHLFYG